MLRADTHPPDMRADYTFDFDPKEYRPDDHALWQELCDRQRPLLTGRACNEYLEALDKLSIMTSGGIPDMRRVSDMLEKTTGWRIVTVPGLIPGDIFHDMFGHVPLLSNPVFADYLQQFGLGAVKAKGLNALHMIERLYWFTVEFGLINTPEGLRIYGSGIVSSKKESVYCLESPLPHRIGFDLERIMRTRYHIDDMQDTYFVIDSFEQLFEETRPDFTGIYTRLRTMPEISDKDTVAGDVILRGA